MTPDEFAIITALSKCRFLPGSWDKRFVRNLAAIAATHPEQELTEKQKQSLGQVAHRYRKQLSSHAE